MDSVRGQRFCPRSTALLFTVHSFPRSYKASELATEKSVTNFETVYCKAGEPVTEDVRTVKVGHEDAPVVIAGEQSIVRQVGDAVYVDAR
ncbi:hypothetical protein ACLOJK_034244 [Asimina triloba]